MCGRSRTRPVTGLSGSKRRYSTRYRWTSGLVTQTRVSATNSSPACFSSVGSPMWWKVRISNASLSKPYDLPRPARFLRRQAGPDRLARFFRRDHCGLPALLDTGGEVAQLIAQGAGADAVEQRPVGGVRRAPAVPV